MTPDNARNGFTQSEHYQDYGIMCWNLHRALKLAARDNPDLLGDPLFQIFSAEAFERFDQYHRDEG